MKELSIEEKAKRYDEIREKARKEYSIHEANNAIGIMDALERVFPELKESEDERIRKEMISWLKGFIGEEEGCGYTEDEIRERIAWLEKQGKHANFCSKIQVGDKVTRNEDGVLVNLSQLKRVAKKDEKQGEQKPADTEKGANGNEREIPNSAWSEKDESMLYGVMETEQYMLDVVNGIKKFDVGIGAIRKECTEELNWLKSLKDRVQPQSTWRPSDEQMEALDDFIYAKYPNTEKHGAAVKSLYQDLKKLTE